MIGLNVTVKLRMAPVDDDSFDAAVEGLMEHMMEVGADSPAVGACGATGQVDVEFSVEADTVENGLTQSMPFVKQALAKAGGRFEGLKVRASDPPEERTAAVG